MAVDERLRELLATHQTPHEVIPHAEAFTADAVAEESHVSDHELAKVVIAREQGGGPLMLVLPACCRADLKALRELAHARKLSLATEEEMAALFPDCEVGAMSPFGSLYDMPVWVDTCFPRREDIVFQAGNHHEVVRMRYDDFRELVHPHVGEFCTHEREKQLTE